MKSPVKQLRRRFMENQLRTTELNSKRRDIDRENITIEWITLFRRNWHIYVDMILGIKLKPFMQPFATQSIMS